MNKLSKKNIRENREITGINGGFDETVRAAVFSISMPCTKFCTFSIHFLDFSFTFPDAMMNSQTKKPVYKAE